ncbi:hypothetical protein PMKS-002707 [Pichia membranifaciens]|uniref:ATP-dependent helicase n=1 Tax=Pichia membranifaciens TaxID=4926 RepID=A0A1Q2YI80_9ASCO|nr:hypothetical protein PMKS-002707 [Pichia membranifaciens]
MLRSVYQTAPKYIHKQGLWKDTLFFGRRRNHFFELNCQLRTVYSDREVAAFENNTVYDLPSNVKNKPEKVEADQDEVEYKDNEHTGEAHEDVVTSDPITLRAYQKECISSIVNTLSSGDAKKLAVSIATGGGKTVIFSMAIPEILKLSRFEGDRANGILILVHRRELANQTIKTIQQLDIVDHDRIFLDMGKNKLDIARTFKDPRPFIIVGSVPTLARVECTRVADYNMDRFKAVIVDECHHSVSTSYKKLFKAFRCSKDQPDERGPFLLGFTATMARTDRVPLRKIFDKIVFEKKIASLIEENHLCDFDWLRIELGLNLQDVEIKGGDFFLDSLAKHINTNEINVIVLKTYLKLKKQFPNNMNSLLAFCVNVAHMQTLSQLFRENGINAQYVSGETKNSERDSIVADFRNGKIPVLFNCGVFTEGTDIPNIDSIFLLRPTKSKPLLIQMIGRGLRLSKGKEKLLVTDFVDSKSLGLSLSSTLSGKPDVLSLIGSLGSSGFNRRDEMLPGDIDYIKFTNYKGIEMLYDESKRTNSPPYELLRNMKRLNSLGTLGHWTQVKFDTWATSSGYRSYFKVEVTKAAEYKASHYFTKVGAHNESRLIINKVCESKDFDSISNGLANYINTHEYIKSEMNAVRQRENNMKHQPITKTQTSFITQIVPTTVEKLQSDALDYKKFMKLFGAKVTGMSRWDAYTLIFAYTVARKQAVLLWLKEAFLKTKEKRALITKESFLKKSQKLVDEGWV